MVYMLPLIDRYFHSAIEYAWILHLQGQDYLAAFYIQKALHNAAEEEKEEIEKHYKIIMKE